LGRDIAIHLIKVYTPYLLAFLLGVIVAWQGCNSESKTITKVIERPVPTIKYVDRWRTDTVRFVSKKVITQRDTIYQDRIVNRLDTLFLVDTISIVEAWLTELVKYDTAVTLNGVNVALKWQNYQNLSEQLSITVKENVVGAKFALGLHANVGIISDFNRSYTPLMGIGIQTTIKSTYISANYGYNGQHFIGVGVGRNIISK
jgi:PBP1b-binding outer membrane lipoprotein LpoB